MRRNWPSKSYVGIAFTVMTISVYAILALDTLIVSEIDEERRTEFYFVLAFPVCVGAITSLAALMIASYTMRESSDAEKGGLALKHIESFDQLLRKALESSDAHRRSVYLREANSFLENACALHDTIRCQYQRSSIERKLGSVFALVVADGLPLHSVHNFDSWTGVLNGVRKAGLKSFRSAQEISV